jgi:hypothetical protein
MRLFVRRADLPEFLEDRLLIFGGAIPVSVTATSTVPSTSAARTSMLPPSAVNFTAFERRFRRTCLTLRWSARIS